MLDFTRRRNWLVRMTVWIVLEKIIAMVIFALANFVVPLGRDWVRYVVLALPGLLAIDIVYGRIIIYGATVGLFRNVIGERLYVEGCICFSSLILSLCIVIFTAGDVEIVLFNGKHPWNCVGYFIVATSGVISALIIWFRYSASSKCFNQSRP